jgi:hypothetical protein
MSVPHCGVGSMKGGHVFLAEIPDFVSIAEQRLRLIVSRDASPLEADIALPTLRATSGHPYMQCRLVAFGFEI